MSNMAKPAAGDGGSRQCIGSGQNLTADFTECRNIAQQATLLSLDSIVIGERHRKDMGDIAGLAANIAELGLPHRWDMHGDVAGTPDEDDRTVEPQERPPEAVLQ